VSSSPPEECAVDWERQGNGGGGRNPIANALAGPMQALFGGARLRGRARGPPDRTRRGRPPAPRPAPRSLRPAAFGPLSGAGPPSAPAAAAAPGPRPPAPSTNAAKPSGAPRNAPRPPQAGRRRPTTAARRWWS
jgi:hypothetical protein